MAWFSFETLGERLGLTCRDGERGQGPTDHAAGADLLSSRRNPGCERLEERALMTAIPGYDYVVTGYRWSNPARITYSIAPDGVLWDHGTNDLNAVFNAKFGTGGIWQAQIARALATWESVANINLVPWPTAPTTSTSWEPPSPIHDSATSGSGGMRSPTTPRLARPDVLPSSQRFHGRGRRRGQHRAELQHRLDLRLVQRAPS